MYHGSYVPLRGQRVSEAYASSVNISFAVRGGLLIRQMHHWAADIFIGSIVVHMARIFFTGAFRKPRELNWTIGITLLILAMLKGFIGYSLPDDLISGTGLRIGYSIAESIPLVGSYMASFLWGGPFPGNGSIIPRFFIIHVLIIPLAILGLLGGPPGPAGAPEAHPVPRQGPHRAQRGRLAHVPHLHGQDHGLPVHGRRRPRPCSGRWPRSTPSGSSAPTTPRRSPTPCSPTGTWAGSTGPCASCRPGSSPASATPFRSRCSCRPSSSRPLFSLCFVCPVLERRFTKDNELHNLLDRPRDRPKRTAAGVAMFAFLFMLFAASSTDVLANFFHVSLNEVLWFFRIATFVVPVVVALVTCRCAGRCRASTASASASGP